MKDFYQAVCLYIHKNENQGIKNLEKALSPFKSVNADLSPYYLAKAKDIILSLGTDTLPNEYLTHTLRELILKYTPEGSFNVWPKVLNYIRHFPYIKTRKLFANDHQLLCHCISNAKT